jgi:WD40 repeat protein
MTDASTPHKAKVFISYSRDDIDFADQLVAALETFGFDALIDRHSIPGGEDWKAQLRHMIVEADSIVFVLSPRSATSKLCEWEVEEADQLNKRLIPIVCAPLGSVSVLPRLADLNYTYFYSEPKVSGSGFGAGLSRLVEALNTDLEWIRDHTRLGALSERWQTRKKDAALLLRGDELEDAERWLASKPPSAPEPTELLRDFLAESRRAEAARLDKERQQLAEIAAAQAAEKKALANIAAEQAHRARSQRITRYVIAAAGALVLTGGGIVAYLQWDKARQLAAKEAALTESKQQLSDAGVRVSAEQARNATLTDSLNKRQIDLDHAQANVLGQLSDVKLLRGEFDSALRFAAQGARIDLGLPSDIKDSFASAALARVVSQTKWRFAFSAQDCCLSAAFSPDGRHIVAASGKTARVWDAENRKQLVVFTGHSGVVFSAAFSPDGSRIVTASADKTARIWDAATGQEIAVLGHDDAVIAAAFNLDGTRIVTGSEDTSVRVWNTTNAEEMAVFRGSGKGGVRSVAFSPDGSRIAATFWGEPARVWDSATGKEVAVLGSDEPAQPGDSASGKRAFIIVSESGGIIFAAFDRDGSRIVTASLSNVARVWDAATAKEIAVMRGHRSIVHTAAFSPDGSRVVTASADNTVRIWDAATGEEVAVLRGHGDTVYSAAFSPDGSRIVSASADNSVRVWDTSNTKEIMVFHGHEGETGGPFPGTVWSAAFNPDGSRIVTASPNAAHIWDAASGKEIAVLPGNWLNYAAFSPDGSRVVTSGGVVVGVWDVATGKEIAVLRDENRMWSAVFSPDGSRIITAMVDGDTARIWDIATGKEIAVLRGHKDKVFSAAFSPDGSRIVTASQDKTARIWDAATGKEIIALPHEYGVRSAGFSPEGSSVVTTSGSIARIWDATTGREIAALRGGNLGALSSAAFSPDGLRIVTAGGNAAHIWDVATATEIAVLSGHADAVRAAVFSPDGSRIVTASEDKTARIWDVRLETMTTKELLGVACMRLADFSRLTRDEMRLAGYPDDTPEIDVCQGLRAP